MGLGIYTVFRGGGGKIMDWFFAKFLQTDERGLGQTGVVLNFEHYETPGRGRRTESGGGSKVGGHFGEGGIEERLGPEKRGRHGS